MAYAAYSRGYKAFGLSAGSGLAEPEAKPEFVNSYEVGLKKDFGHSLQVNAAVYYLDYLNLQAPVNIRVGPLTVSQFVNIAKSRSAGLELDAIWQPIDPLRISLDYSYDNTRILKGPTKFDVGGPALAGPVSVVGNKLPQAPENKVAVNANYSFHLDPGILTLGATYVWRDKAYANIFTAPWNEAPSWDQVDLRANFTSNDGKYVIIAYVKNVFDTLGYNAAVAAEQRSAAFANGVNVYELTPPRIFGVELQYKFF